MLLTDTTTTAQEGTVKIDTTDAAIGIKWLAQSILDEGQTSEAAQARIARVESPDDVQEALNVWRDSLGKIEALQEVFQTVTGQYPSLSAVHRAANGVTF